MTVATPVQPDSTADSGTQYKSYIDAAFKVVSRFATWFAAHENDAGSPGDPDMTVRVEAGWIWNGVTLTDIPAQSTGTITAPVSNPRIDLVVVDAETGVVSVVTGSESASPSAPAVTAGKLPVAQVALTVAQTTIENTDLTDIRSFPLPPPATQVEAEAGTETDARLWSPQRIKQAIDALAGTANLKSDMRLAFLKIAENAGDRVNMVDGIADPFADETDMDLATSTNEVFFPAGYFRGLSPTAANAAQDVKTGSNTQTFDAAGSQAGIRWTQSGDAVALGARLDVHNVGTAGNVRAELCVFGNATAIAQSGSVAVGGTGEIDFTFNSPVALTNGVSYVLVFVRLSGLYTLSTVTAPGTDTIFSAVSSAILATTLTSDVNMDASEDLRCGLLTGSVADLALVSDTFTADSAPATGRIHVQVFENESITVNTDLIAEISRDGGSTWSTATLALVETLADGTKAYEDPAVDLSGQPSDTAMQYRISTANTKDVEIHGVVFQWD